MSIVNQFLALSQLLGLVRGRQFENVVDEVGVVTEEMLQIPDLISTIGKSFDPVTFHHYDFVKPPLDRSNFARSILPPAILLLPDRQCRPNYQGVDGGFCTTES
ncbi:hypothetical protein FRC03_011668 [Tulasnella sp. 419]|nr:hypothetical protein FRC03_011668 [Tulasnella sp. 419]